MTKKACKKLDVKPILKNKSKQMHNDYGLIPSFPNRCLFIAPTGSGKSVVIVNLLTRKRCLRNFFDVVSFYSPNVNYEEEHIETKIKNEKAEMKFEEKFKEKEFGAMVHKLMKEQKELKDKKKPMKKTLITIDDFASDEKVMKSKTLKDLFFAGRKCGTCVWITSQHYKIVQPDVRTNAEHLIMFSRQPSSELKKIAEEMSIGKYTKKKIIEMFDEMSTTDYSFLHYDRKQPMNERYMMNFESFMNI
eukprot:jgi/Bigna1/134770/aug1.26_g9478